MEKPIHDEIWKKALSKRKEENSFRELKINTRQADFSSNDYLGLARNPELQQIICNEYDKLSSLNKLGSTGSRLITGNNFLFEQTEELIAKTHSSEESLIFSSGYLANLAVFSSLPQKGDTVLYDELCHACIKDGIRLSLADRFSFLHNDLNSLENKLRKAKGNVFVGVESVYSMDGDFAPLEELVQLCNKYNALLIVDEAHTTGVFGKNGAGFVCELGLQDQIPVRIHTFGKAMGCHGAAVVCSRLLKDYLVNFSRPFIFTTAINAHSLVSISEAYKYVADNKELQSVIHQKISFFNDRLKHVATKITSFSTIHAFVFPGNKAVKDAATSLNMNDFDVRPILSPTVKKGSERLRICLHTFNSEEEIDRLSSLLKAL